MWGCINYSSLIRTEVVLKYCLVKTCALQPFVDKTNLIPISLKIGNPIGGNELKNYDAIPKNYKEFLTFFAEVSKRIALRNECIYFKLSS